MGALTYVKAHLLRNIDARYELAMKDSFDVNKVQTQIAKKLKSINNSNHVYDLQKSSKYNNMMVELESKKQSSWRSVSEGNQIPAQDLKIATQMGAGGKLGLPDEIINHMKSPEQVTIKKNELLAHLDTILGCSNMTEVNATNKIRSVTTNLQYLSDYNHIEEDKSAFKALLQQPIAGEKFSAFGNHKIDSDTQYNAVMVHLHTIKLWMNEQNPTGTNE
ncbi:hypothetical protein [Enterobacter sp. ENT03]|uniref:hypothetical protein n=1 Tax=Enterobacter sp. ENT03 TaxID=2854780 RepID=UPI001C45880C|nr:hypothetical protein [Enterobacter sp. ENT03]MBV7405863.1 hypothetical protein [Enterobacter sp. ENT03]